MNELLKKEAETLTQAARYERNETRQGYRSGHYARNFTTTSGDVALHMPRLKGIPFESAIIERCRGIVKVVLRRLLSRCTGRCFGTSGRRHHRSSVGKQNFARNYQRVKQEGLCSY